MSEDGSGFSVSPSVKLMLLQGQIQSSQSTQSSQSSQNSQSSVSPAPPASTASTAAPGVPASASELAAVLSSLRSDGEDCRALLRRAAASRQLGEGVEEELRLAEDALDLFRAEGGPPWPSRATSSTSPNWEAAALCAVAEAHLGIQDAPKALEAAEEARALCRAQRSRTGEAEALVVQFKAQLLTISEDQRIVRELLALWRELGATWGEVAETLSMAERCRASGVQLEDALADAAEKRELEHRWGLAQDLCAALCVHPAFRAKAKLLRLLEAPGMLPHSFAPAER
ncbi:unnamed protein product [Symbiodinium natans]|uniref:Uncharacterized protein n=1 Tax=Symbiodinium natans TaxID=878477 RepID=A0A812T6D7_9DINO|nr:unnamed protein product [Symbiodinium natans]